MRNLTYFCKKMETDVDPRLSSTLAYSDLHEGEGDYLRNKQEHKAHYKSSFPEQITSRKDIVTDSFLNFFLGPKYFRIFFHVLYFGIFFVSCSKGGVASHPIHPPRSAPG